MKKRPNRTRLFPGILLHGNKIWISELAGIVFVLLFGCSVGLAGVIIRHNEKKIRSAQEFISLLTMHRMELRQIRTGLHARSTIARLLTTFTHGRIEKEVLHKVANTVYRNSRAYGYDPLLLLAVIHVESVFDPRALGKYRSGRLSGAYGLMQLKLETAREVAEELGLALPDREDLFNPAVNIVLGSAYLTKLVADFKSLKLGILAYNQGPGVMKKSLSGKLPLSIRYYNKVLRSYYLLKELAASDQT